MVEGLALGAFRFPYQSTGEPLLKEMLRYVIQDDEARHVHYGVLALRETLTITAGARESAKEPTRGRIVDAQPSWPMRVMMKWFDGTSVTRDQWRQLIAELARHARFRQ